jgi:hypothetical protein
MSEIVASIEALHECGILENLRKILSNGRDRASGVCNLEVCRKDSEARPELLSAAFQIQKSGLGFNLDVETDYHRYSVRINSSGRILGSKIEAKTQDEVYFEVHELRDSDVFSLLDTCKEDEATLQTNPNVVRKIAERARDFASKASKSGPIEPRVR